MTIWKFKLDITDTQELVMPEGAIFLSAAEQFGEICLWAQVDERRPLSKRRVHVYGTGNPMTTIPTRFLATVVTRGGHLVWHVFEGA